MGRWAESTGVTLSPSSACVCLTSHRWAATRGLRFTLRVQPSWSAIAPGGRARRVDLIPTGRLAEVGRHHWSGAEYWRRRSVLDERRRPRPQQGCCSVRRRRSERTSIVSPPTLEDALACSTMTRLFTAVCSCRHDFPAAVSRSAMPMVQCRPAPDPNACRIGSGPGGCGTGHLRWPARAAAAAGVHRAIPGLVRTMRSCRAAASEAASPRCRDRDGDRFTGSPHSTHGPRRSAPEGSPIRFSSWRRPRPASSPGHR